MQACRFRPAALVVHISAGDRTAENRHEFPNACLLGRQEDGRPDRARFDRRRKYAELSVAGRPPGAGTLDHRRPTCSAAPGPLGPSPRREGDRHGRSVRRDEGGGRRIRHHRMREPRGLLVSLSVNAAVRGRKIVSVIDWLLDSDPAIRWQAMRDLTDTPADQVAAERARVATEGWGARLLSLRQEDGLWHTGTSDSEWPSLLALLMLGDMGLDASSEQARKAIGLVRDNLTWHSRGPWHGTPVFAGEVEPCINGRVVTVGSYFGLDVTAIVERLLGEQMADGGWNCEQENGSTRGSFHTTINVLEGLLDYERSTGGPAEVTAARERGHEYLLERRMLRRLSKGELIDPAFTLFSFPTGWHYDALRGLDYLRAADVTPDARVAEAIDLVRSKRDAEGRVPLENPHGSEMVNARVRDLEFDMDEREGRPSRWNTLRALRVLRWAGRS